MPVIALKWIPRGTLRVMEFERIAGALGAMVKGIDLGAPISLEDAEALRNGLAEHQALFFREQPLEPAHHRALAKVFGEPQPHPAYPTIDGYPELSVLEVTEAEPPRINTWHTDMTFMECPPLGSILHGVVIPPVGGDTLFLSLTRAFESLDKMLQDLLVGREAEHSFAYGFRHSIALMHLASDEARARLENALAKNPPRRHPVIRTHPVTQKRVLFVNPLFTTRIIGMPESQSDSLLRLLYQHIVEPEHTCRFRWAPNSIAIWDNRATQHRPINDFWPAHRKMQRITIAGDIPR